MQYPTQHAYLVIIAAMGMVIFVLAIGWSAAVLQPKGRVTCGSFGSYEDILEAYKAGATWLDGNDHDRRPCESRA